jgi:hypothetical protein
LKSYMKISTSPDSEKEKILWRLSPYKSI